MKIKGIKKFIATSLLGIGLALPTYSSARPNIPLFISEYQKLLSIMLNSYKENVKSPLDARIFDISNPNYYNFLKNTTHREYKNEFLAVLYYSDFLVNNKATSFCFILYDPRDTVTLEQYLTNTFFRPEDSIYYLVAHEFGHCIASHQAMLGKISPILDEAQGEQIADMFAMGFFLSRGEDKQARSLIKQLKEIPKEDSHHNPKELQKFYLLFTKDKPKISNVYELFEKSHEYFLQISKNPDLLEKEIKEMDNEEHTETKKEDKNIENDKEKKK